MAGQASSRNTKSCEGLLKKIGLGLEKGSLSNITSIADGSCHMIKNISATKRL